LRRAQEGQGDEDEHRHRQRVPAVVQRAEPAARIAGLDIQHEPADQEDRADDDKQRHRHADGARRAGIHAQDEIEKALHVRPLRPLARSV